MIRFEELQEAATCGCCGGEDLAADGSCADCEAGDCDGWCEFGQRRAERAHERMVEDFYGSSSPVTDTERHQAAWKVGR